MHHSKDFAEALLPLSALDIAPGPIDRALATFRAWRDRRRERVELSQLDRRMLNDIGLTREGRRIDWIV